MIFRLFIDRNCQEEVIANVHERTPLIDEIERLVSQDISDRVAGYNDDEITMLAIADIECFAVENEKTYAVSADGRRYLVKKRLYEPEKSLPSDFVKISRSALANFKRIARFRVQLSGAVDAEFGSGYVECISRRCFAEIKRGFGL